jgi:voltage-gated potassium channel
MAGYRAYLGARVAVTLTGAVALLSVITGISNISQASVAIGVPLVPIQELVPPAAQTVVGFTGALTGFLMLGTAAGLRRRLRVAWYLTVVLLPLTALQGLVTGSVLSLPLVVVSLLALPSVLLSRRSFDRKVSLSVSQRAAGLTLIGVQAYGTAGTYALRADFTNVSTLTDAFYYTLVTASTVGYGDITPAPDSELATLFAMSVVIFGTISFAVALGTLLGPALERRFARALGRMTESQLDLLEDHVLVLGYGDLTEPILNELRSLDVDFVVVTEDERHVSELNRREIPVLEADPSDEESLETAGLDRALAVVAATNQDAEDALGVLTARQLRPGVRIVAAATQRENEDKLRRAGADTVVSPAVLGGHMLVEAALDRGDAEQASEEILGDELDDNVE